MGMAVELSWTSTSCSACARIGESLDARLQRLTMPRKSSDPVRASQEIIVWCGPGGRREGSAELLQVRRTDSISSAYRHLETARVSQSPISDTSCSGYDTVGDVSEEEVYEQDEKKTLRGWRRLVSVEDVKQQGNSKAFILKNPRRSSKFVRQRTKVADDFAIYSPRKETKMLLINRDPVLEALFKSLTSPKSGNRSSAVERYFARELKKKTTEKGNQGMPTERIAERDSFTSENAVGRKETEGRATGPLSRRESEGGSRLKINLDLDLYRAKCFREEGRLDDAETILKDCIRDWPDDGRAYLAWGLLALPLNSNQIKEADRDLRDDLNGRMAAEIENQRTLAGDNFMSVNAAEEGTDGSRTTVLRSPAVSEGGERLKINLDLLLYQAKCCRQKGRIHESEAILRMCIRDWPDDGRPYVTLGKQLLQQNRIQEARDLYDSGCQAARGENPYIWQAWAILEERSGDVTKARKLFDASTVADKKHAASWHGWAKLELRAGNVKRARSLLNKGLRFGGSNEYIFQTLALLECSAGQVEQARSFLSKAIQHNPKSAASWLAWALIEAQNNLSETARRLFQKGIEASPKNRYVWQAWALFEAKFGKEECARELFQAGHELNPQDAVLLQAFALFEFKCGRPGVARDLFRRALACDSSHQPVWIAWGWMEWKEGNLSVARELYQGAIQADSRSMDAVRAFQAWGVLEDREGDSGLARELFHCALKIDSQNVPTWMSLAAVEDRVGRSVRADEIRNLFLQQRTEVVEGVPWDVDFSDLLAPAIDGIRGFFKVNQRPAWTGTNSIETDVLAGSGSQSERELEVVGLGASAEAYSADQEFDVTSFLKEKFPWKYGSVDVPKSYVSSSVRRPTRSKDFCGTNV